LVLSKIIGFGSARRRNPRHRDLLVNLLGLGERSASGRSFFPGSSGMDAPCIRIRMWRARPAYTRAVCLQVGLDHGIVDLEVLLDILLGVRDRMPAAEYAVDCRYTSVLIQLAAFAFLREHQHAHQLLNELLPPDRHEHALRSEYAP